MTQTATEPADAGELAGHSDLAGRGELAAATQRIGELVQALDGLKDRSAADAARALLQQVLNLHGRALERIMTVAGECGGAQLLPALLRDEWVSNALLLHGLHRDDAESRVRAALERLHAQLGVRGVAVEECDIVDNCARVRLRQSDAGRYSSADRQSIFEQVQAALACAAPDLAAIEVAGLPHSVSVPVANVGRRRAAVAVSPP